MTTFTRRELELVEQLADPKAAKKLDETADTEIDQLRAKLFADKRADIPERFRDVTGWSHKPTDYV